MSNEVFANGREISCKSGDGKSICEFPDVCMTPPTTPATPMGVPVPYPNTGFSSDTTKGSRTVKIDKKEVMLRNKSYYKTSTGDEAGCATPAKKGLITGTTKGKVYFISWSPDVKIEGENVVRTSDMTTHNHASYPGNGSVPMADVEGVALAISRLEDDKCSCCGGEKHASGKAMNRDEWYNDCVDDNLKSRIEEVNKISNVDKHSKKMQDAVNKSHKKKVKLNKLLKRAKKRPRCTCPKPRPPLLPKPPCDVFYKKSPDAVVRKAEHDAIDEKWENYKPTYQEENGILSPSETKKNLKNKLGRAPLPKEIDDERSVNHLTPKSAGGCPDNDTNLQANTELCDECKKIDDSFSEFQ